MGDKVTDIKPAPALQHDGRLWVSTGRSRYEKNWKGRETYWSRIVGKLETPVRTPETYAEYMKLTRTEQERIKDVGGFVGGTLKDGKRGAKTVISRSIVCLDLDQAPVDFWDDFTMTAEYGCACYSTHKSRKDKPRLRLLIPLQRPVTPDEYEAVARMLADDIGMDYMDPTTFQPSRLMYWPSCSTDGDYFFDFQDAGFLDPDKVLSRYEDWHDASLWPVSRLEVEKHRKDADKQADPLQKKGIVGAFCRVYDIAGAIRKFLPEVYTPTDKEDRYTYAAGSSAAGLVLYEDGKFAFSNHGTDPVSGLLVNSFDLVRIHLYGSEDESVRADTSTTKLPSYKKMCELASADPDVRGELYESQHEQISKDFSDDGEDGEPEPLERKDVAKQLSYTQKGGIEKTVANCETVFTLDQALRGLSYNLLSGEIVIDSRYPLPWEREPGSWKDSDDAQLYTYVAKWYAEFARAAVTDQKIVESQKHRFHPVREYLASLPEWDGVPRVDSLLIDYLGAEDNIYTREATRKTLLAAVTRIYEPGTKFDEMLVIAGPQGCGKSTLISRLAGDWFSDSLSFDDMKDKTGAEKLQGYWILEIGELKGMRKMDMESIKAFISRQDDIYRAAYGRNTERHPRQCIIFGTVNNQSGFLKDITGNRRFWPIECSGEGSRKSWDLSQEDRSQIWAEVLHLYRSKSEKLILSPEADELASKAQTDAIEVDDREGLVADYLSMKLPENWRERNLEQRRDYIDDWRENSTSDAFIDIGEDRSTVTNLEIWCECFREPMMRIEKKDSYMIAGILKRLGWESCGERSRDPLYGRQRCYRKVR